jgi:hypothetical protein
MSKYFYISNLICKDNEGIEIAKNVKDNKHLEKLELEGNMLGSKTAFEVGELLKTNNVLRLVDLEFNNLTDHNTNNPNEFHVEGIKNLAEVFLTYARV